LNEDSLKKLLEDLKVGEMSVDDALQRLKHLPFEDIGLACIDHHRGLRRGLSEVIFGEGKDAEDIIAIMDRIIKQDENILITRLSPEKAEKVKERYPKWS
jgi:NCAIR mutase (PurE)-related protein